MDRIFSTMLVRMTATSLSLHMHGETEHQDLIKICLYALFTPLQFSLTALLHQRAYSNEWVNSYISGALCLLENAIY